MAGLSTTLSPPSTASTASPRLSSFAEQTGLTVKGFTGFANPDYFSFSPLLRRGAVVCDYLLGKVDPGWGRLYFVVTLQKPFVAALPLSA